MSASYTRLGFKLAIIFCGRHSDLRTRGDVSKNGTCLARADTDSCARACASGYQQVTWLVTWPTERLKLAECTADSPKVIKDFLFIFAVAEDFQYTGKLQKKKNV